MKKFSIEYHETYGRTYEIEANSPEEAEEILKERIREGMEDPPEECENSWCDNIQKMKETDIYVSIEDKLEEIISNESVDMIEEFLGYELTFTAPEDIHSQVRDTLDQMPEDELEVFYQQYLIE